MGYRRGSDEFVIKMTCGCNRSPTNFLMFLFSSCSPELIPGPWRGDGLSTRKRSCIILDISFIIGVLIIDKYTKKYKSLNAVALGEPV